MTEPTSLWHTVDAFAELLWVSFERWPVVRTGTREPISDIVRIGVKTRDGWACVWCKSRHRPVLDHIVPWSAGGSDHPTNLRTLCWTCNEDRSNYRYVDDAAPSLPLTALCVRCDPDMATDDVRVAFCVSCKRREMADPREEIHS